jgi:hypothetical protein
MQIPGKLDKFHSFKVQEEEEEDQGGDRQTLALSTTFASQLLPQNISRGRRRCKPEQEKVFHEYAGGPWRIDERGQKGGRREKAPRPPQQFWRLRREHERRVVTRDRTEFGLKYRFEDSHGDCGHGGRQGHFRDGKKTKEEPAAAAKVSQQMDEKAADGNHGDTDNGSQPHQLGHQEGGAQPGKEAGDGTAAGNLAWVSSAGEAQEAVRRMLEEQAPRIGYCHECGWWHELPRCYSFKMSVRTRRRQHGRLAGRAAA